MPLFFQHTINEFSKLAIWKITEPEDFFLREATVMPLINNGHKRLQHLAGRYLLKIIEPSFPINKIEILQSRKPHLPGKEFHFSISHCRDFVGVFIATQPVGFDIELVDEKVNRIKNKFLSDEELQLLKGLNGPNYLKTLTLFWSCKEALFKWYGKGSVDFKKNILLKKFFCKGEGGHVQAFFKKEEEFSLEIQYWFLNDLCVSWVFQDVSQL
jgi:phosphopantetheinyl transferase